MNLEESFHENEADPDVAKGSVERRQPGKRDKRKVVLIGIGLSLLSCCICLLATGVLNFNTDFYAGGISIEEVVVTDELGPDERPLSRVSKSVFEPVGRIDAAVYTSGVDGTVGMRWYHEDTLIFEAFERTRDNYIATYLEGLPHSPLPAGQYRVDIHLGRGGSPIETVRFTVKELELEVVPTFPTPEGHVDIENATFVEVPFAFDEVWQIEGEEWYINEVKIVFLESGAILVMVVETDLNPVDFSEEELIPLARPIAEYALENGYLEQARQIQINGETHQLDEPLAITFINPENPGRGNRVRLEIDELLSR